MATVDITVTITTPTGMTAAEATRLFTDHHGYQTTVGGESNPETRAQFAKRTVARMVREAIQTQRRNEASTAASSAVPDDVTAA